MNLEKKQRIIGIIIIIVSMLIISVFIFTNRSNKKKSNILSENDTIAVQLAETNLQQGGAPEQITGQLLENMTQPTIEYALSKKNIETNNIYNDNKTSISPIVPIVQKNNNELKNKNNKNLSQNDRSLLKNNVTINLKKIEKKLSTTSNISKKQSSNDLINKNKSYLSKNSEQQQQNWSIQVGSFSDYDKAQAVSKLLYSNGFNKISIKKISLKGYKAVVYRVLVGEEIAKDRLLFLNKKLKTLKINGYFVKNKNEI